jgi:hypothetical protein
VGISPFGIWRPGHPPGIEGFDQYAGLYADAKLWLNQGWVDYYTPQLYWPIKQEKQSYPRLLEWWAGENTKGRHLWPGMIPSRVTGTEKGWPAREIADQVRATRAQKGATGDIHFSMKPLLANTGGVADALKEVYTEPALVPASPWLSQKPPRAPLLAWGDETNGRRALYAYIRPKDESVRRIVVRSRLDGRWNIDVRLAEGGDIKVVFDRQPDKVVVTAVDRLGIESGPATR